MDLTDKLAAAWDKAEILTFKNALMAGAAVGAAFVVVKVYGRLSEGAEDVGEAIGSSFAELQQFFNGSHKTEATDAGFVLLDKYISDSGRIDGVWRDAIAQAHKGNAALMAAISTPEGFLKTEYMGYINQEITPEVVS